MALKSKLQSPLLAFSSSGKRLACVVTEGALCWDVATGQLLNEIPANGAHFQGGIAFPDDKYLFAGNEVMLDLENQLQLWSYSGAEFTTVVGETTIMAVTEGERPGLILTAKLPHPDACGDAEQGAVGSEPVRVQGRDVRIPQPGGDHRSGCARQGDPGDHQRTDSPEMFRGPLVGSPNPRYGDRAEVHTSDLYQPVWIWRWRQTYSVQEWTSTLEFVLAVKSSGPAMEVPTFRNDQSEGWANRRVDSARKRKAKLPHL